VSNLEYVIAESGHPVVFSAMDVDAYEVRMTDVGEVARIYAADPDGDFHCCDPVPEQVDRLVEALIEWRRGK
jgi:hypothetical protein